MSQLVIDRLMAQLYPLNANSSDLRPFSFTSTMPSSQFINRDFLIKSIIIDDKQRGAME